MNKTTEELQYEIGLLSAMVSALVGIQNGWSIQKHFAGICNEILRGTDGRRLFSEEYGIIKTGPLLIEAFEKWPRYSGNEIYPIPVPESVTMGSTEFDNIYWSWDKDTETGQLRWELLCFLITEFQRQLEAARTAYRLADLEIRKDKDEH